MKLWNDIRNMFGPERDFFNKEATIKEYLASVCPKERTRINDYEMLFQEALRFVEKQDFNKNTSGMEGYFYELSKDEGVIAVLLGVVAYGASKGIDENGKKIEAAIDRALPKGYDVNNPFDAKEGYGHRIFGHDPATFGIKNIPADTVIKVKYGNNIKKMPIRIGDFLGIGTDGNVSMWDLIWKIYGDDVNKASGVMNCIKHSIVHFAKDLFTPAGLPLPFVTLFNKYEHFENLEASALQYKDSLMQKCDKLGLQLKASDFISLFIIESFLAFYCKSKKLEEREDGFRQDMKLIAMGTCISLQMATIVMGQGLQVQNKGNKAIIPGGKTNALMMSAFVKITIQEIVTTSKERHIVNENYMNEGRSNE